MSELHQAIKAIKTGDKAAGKRLLRQFIETDPNDEIAWMWLAVAVEDSQQKVQCLQRVLEINPDNSKAQLGLSQLQLNKPVEAPQIEDMIPGISSPQTELVDREKNTRKKSGYVLSIIAAVMPLCWGSIIFAINPGHMGRMLLSCKSRGVSEDVCSQPIGWIMLLIILMSAIISYFAGRKATEMASEKKWGLFIMFTGIFGIFITIAMLLTSLGPAIILIIETPFGTSF